MYEYVYSRLFKFFEVYYWFNQMTLTTFFWILVGISIVVLMAIRFDIKKELFTPIFWLLIGISFMVLIGIFWNLIKVS